MKYLKLYENFNDSDIHDKCEKYGIQNYTINEDGSIDVNGNVNFYDQDLEETPIKFRNITGSFFYTSNRLKSLKNCPVSVGGDFNCGNNQLTSLEGCPEFVGGYFYCNDNKLTSLEYYPEYINGDFNCMNNKLTSLEFCPEFVGGFFYCGNNQLTSLEGCPNKVSSNFNCTNNQLTSLKFMPKCTFFNCATNYIIDFKGFVEPNDLFYCSVNPISNIWELFKDKSHIELLNEYDCIRGEDIIIDRLNQFLEEINKEPVESVKGYNNI